MLNPTEKLAGGILTALFQGQRGLPVEVSLRRHRKENGVNFVVRWDQGSRRHVVLCSVTELNRLVEQRLVTVSLVA